MIHNNIIKYKNIIIMRNRTKRDIAIKMKGRDREEFLPKCNLSYVLYNTIESFYLIFEYPKKITYDIKGN